MLTVTLLRPGLFSTVRLAFPAIPVDVLKGSLSPPWLSAMPCCCHTHTILQSLCGSSPIAVASFDYTVTKKRSTCKHELPNRQQEVHKPLS